jgi:NAD(P)-dependent dehydrogenase (short-subunit alcohol dehydrogenase family)
MEDTATSIAHPGAVAVITGAASGIGLAAAKYLAARGMSLVLVDVSPLDDAAAAAKAEGAGDVLTATCDVSDIAQVVALRDKVLDHHGEVHLLLNNAGISRPCPAISLDRDLADLQAGWAGVLGTNGQGIINVAQAFGPFMARQENASIIINTGSKQGITNPPGNAGYNVSKAMVKTFTEQLAYQLRNLPECVCTAHLFVPGWVFTGLTGGGGLKTKPPGAWTAEQTVEYMFDKVLNEGDFYVICPDNETPPAVDKARMQWTMDDIIHGRPALSRWSPEYAARFDDFVMSKQGLNARSRSRGRPLAQVPESPYPPENADYQPSSGQL